VGLLLNRVVGVQSQADLQALRDQLAARIRVISRRLEPVQGPRRADRVRVLLRVVGAAPSSPPETAAIFETAGLVLDVLSSRMTRLANGDLGDAINPSGADEIARMEGAAEVFRQQAIANGDLAAERERQLKELRRHRSELCRAWWTSRPRPCAARWRHMTRRATGPRRRAGRSPSSWQ